MKINYELPNQIKDLPITEAVTLGTEWFLVFTAFLLGTLSETIKVFANLSITGAARLSGKGVRYKDSIPLTGYQLARNAAGLLFPVKKDKDKYQFDHNGKEVHENSDVLDETDSSVRLSSEVPEMAEPISVSKVKSY